MTESTNLKFTNVKNRIYLDWDYDVIIHDQDGSLGGIKNGYVVYNDDINVNNPNCRNQSYLPDSVSCANSHNWIRFSFNNPRPEFALILNITNQANRTAWSPKKFKRLTHPIGFMCALEAMQGYQLGFDEAPYPTNISYTGTYYSLYPGDYVVVKHQMLKKPDLVSFGYSYLTTSESLFPLTASNKLGDWYWENSTKTLSYFVANSQNRLPILDVDMTFSALKCRYAGCQPPISPALKLPVTSRPNNALFWSNFTTWQIIAAELGNNALYAQFPKEYDDIRIPDGVYVVVDTVLPKFRFLMLEGILELDNQISHKLEFDILFINGGQLIIGWENDPILTDVQILVNGQKSGLGYILPNNIDSIGYKAIGVYGGLDIHGKPRNVSWTTLQTTASIGDNKITLVKAVDWQVGEQIVITTTSFRPLQTEVFTISAVSADRKMLTLNSTLIYDHLAFNETTASGKSYKIAAGVGLLSRNVKVIGTSYPNQEADLFGFRIIVSDYSFTNSDGLDVYYKGFARLTDVEFDHPGQFSRAAQDDSLYGILISNLGEYDYKRPTYIRNCAFHDAYSAAIGILDTATIPVENNVIYRTIEFGIRLTGHSNIIRNNLVALNRWASSFLPWEAPFDFFYWGAISFYEADSIVLEGNFIAGAERMGVFYKGDVCPGDSLGPGKNHSIKDNTIYGTLGGVAMLPAYYFENLTCIKISGFTIFKSSHYGIYYQSYASLIVDSNVLIDNQINVFSMVIAPPGLSHLTSNKTILVQNSLIVGRSLKYDCDKDIKPDDLNFQYATTITAYGAGNDVQGKIGIIWANFLRYEFYAT